MQKRSFSLKSIVFSRLVVLSVLFILFGVIFFLLFKGILMKNDKIQTESVGKRMVLFVEEKVASESQRLINIFTNFKFLSVESKDISQVAGKLTFGKDVNVNIYKRSGGIYLPIFSSGNKPLNNITMADEMAVSASGGGFVIYKKISGDELYLNGYFGQNSGGEEYIVQLSKKVLIDILSDEKFNFYKGEGFKYYNFDNEPELYSLDAAPVSKVFYIPSLRQYMGVWGVSHFESFKSVYIGIVAGLCILFVIWLFTEVYYYKFSTKPIIEITNSLSKVLNEKKEIDFKEQRIEEFNKISVSAKSALFAILSEQKKVETLLNRLPIPVVVIDTMYEFRYRNSAFTTLFSITEESINNNFLDIIPDPMKIIEQQLTIFMSSQKQKDKIEVYDPKRNEYYIVRFGKIFDKDDKLNSVIILFNDITYQKLETEKQKKRGEEVENILASIEEAVLQLSSSSSELKASAESLSTMLAEQNTSISETNTAIQELNTSADSIFKKVQHIAEVSEKVDNVSKVGFEGVDNSFEKINKVINITDKLTNTIFELNKKTSNIEKILKTIYEISEQTNLLALNASIEAVRGENNSKSFKIIAEEIRELSDKTYSFSKDIEKELEDVSNVGSSSVMIVEEAEKHLKESFQHLGKNKENFSFIKEEVDHINKHLKEIIGVLKDLNSASGDIYTTSNDLLVAMKDALGSAKESLQTTIDIDSVTKNLTETLSHLKRLK